MARGSPSPTLDFSQKVQTTKELHSNLFPSASPEAVDLMHAMLRFDPSQRPTTTEALAHAYFSADPPPAAPKSLPQPVPPEQRHQAMAKERLTGRVGSATKRALSPQDAGEGDEAGPKLRLAF